MCCVYMLLYTIFLMFSKIETCYLDGSARIQRNRLVPNNLDLLVKKKTQLDNVG